MSKFVGLKYHDRPPGCWGRRLMHIRAEVDHVLVVRSWSRRRQAWQYEIISAASIWAMVTMAREHDVPEPVEAWARAIFAECDTPWGDEEETDDDAR